MRKLNKVKELANIKKGCFMKGRIFITIMGLAIMLVSVNAKAQTTTDGLTGKVNVDFTYSGGDITIPGKLGWINDDATTTKAATDSKVAMIDCTHPHGLVQIMEGFGEYIFKPLLASKVYLAEIEADKTVDLAKYVGYTDASGNYSPGYFGVMSQMVSNPLYWQTQMYGSMGGLGGTNSYNSGYYGAYSAGLSNPRW
jgi:hypothetical protein